MGKVSAYPSASGLDGSELVYVVQGGAGKKATMEQVKAFASGSGGTVPVAALHGLILAKNGADRIDVGAGCVDLSGLLCVLPGKIIVPMGGLILEGGKEYFVYANRPAEGATLTATDFSMALDVPVYDEDRGGSYHPTDTTKRCVGRAQTDGDAEFLFLSDVDGNFQGQPRNNFAADSWPNPAIHNAAQGFGPGSVWYGGAELFICEWADGSWSTWTRLPIGVRKVTSVMLLDADEDITIELGTLGNVEIPIPSELNGYKVVDAQVEITQLGTVPSESACTFTLIRQPNGGSSLELTESAISIVQGAYKSGAVTMDTDNNTLATGDLLSLECADADPSGAKGPLWLTLKFDNRMG